MNQAHSQKRFHEHYLSGGHSGIDHVILRPILDAVLKQSVLKIFQHS